jgi:hypothetical protein
MGRVTMSEYEAFDLFANLVSQTYQLMFGFFSLISAFLIMSYSAAQKLNNVLSSIVIVLFTIISLFFVLQFYFVNTVIDSLYIDMLTKKQTEIFELNWFGSIPAWTTQLVTFIQILIAVGGYFGGLFFYFYRRKTADA